jgi:hypothetical protein
MQTVQRHIEASQAELASHPLFSRFHDRAVFERAMAFVPRLAFWVFVFQDILRLNEERVGDAELRRIARHHRAEDAGHHRWFLDDVAALGLGEMRLDQLFEREHAPARDASYALLAEVFGATDDRLRIVLLLVLESTGHVFFDRVAAFTERHGYGQRLQYFSMNHLDVEKKHALFEQRMNEHLATIALEPAARADALALVDRGYAAFRGLFDHLAAERPATPRRRHDSRVLARGL